MDETENERPLSPARLSKTPSWITLGFALGAMFVLALPRDRPAAPAQAPAIDRAPVRLERPVLTEIEAVFAEWSQYAAWEHDITEVALWDADRKSYAICYEVLRSGDSTFFRSIPHLTRPVLTHGVPANSPLQFTETEEQRQQWLRARWENTRWTPPPQTKPAVNLSAPKNGEPR
jgi:hypothetical protein